MRISNLKRLATNFVTENQPGHEYTKGNVKFAAKIAQQDEAVQKLQAFADANKQTQGKSTIGDEKVSQLFKLL